MATQGHTSTYHQSPLFSQRSENEKKILHQYYHRVNEAKQKGGVSEPGEVINSFPEKQRKIIHDFLHDIGTKGSHASHAGIEQ